MAWYSAGTIQVAANGTVATGTGTAFLGNVRVGDGITIAGSTTQHEVIGVSSNTQLTFSPAYAGTTGSGKAYRIVPVNGYDKDLSDAFNQIRLQWGTQLSSLQPWAYAATADIALGNLGGSASGIAVFKGTPAQGRTALELGNAATATVQSSNTDSTVGRLMTTGAFGLGTNGAQSRTRPEDCNAATVSGFYAVGGTALNRPPQIGGSAGLLEVYVWENNTTIKFQRFLLINTGNAVSRTFVRFTDVSGVWGEWVEQFTQRSILGTVSQSAGVPTGAIIERGSNANGEYVRFADGTQICTMRRSVSLAIDQVFIGGFRSDYTAWTYPVNFAGGTLPCLQGSAPVTAHGVSFQGEGTSGANIFVLAPTSQPAGTRIISVTAIGRWF